MTKKLIKIILMGLFSFLFGCENNSNTAQQNYNLVDITSRLDQAEGWSDIFLTITTDTKTDTSHIYIAKGLYKDKIVGIQIEVLSNISAGIVDGKLDSKSGFVTNAVKLKSLGQESDSLVKALAELYKQPSDKGFTKQTISATIFSLNDKPVDLDKKDYYKLKVFFEENDENLYSEIFFNINTNKGEIEIHEKDESYRESIIKIWTK